MAVTLSAGPGSASGYIAEPGDTLLARLLHWVLAGALMLYVFVGVNPLSYISLADRADGNPLDRLAVLGLAALALMVLAVHWRAIPALALRGAGIWIVTGIAVLSILWSNYPGLTLRRSIVLACLTLAGAGVAAGVRDLRGAHTAFCYAITAIVVFNLFAIVALPALAISDIGAKGIYSQKNVAGMVAMIAVLANATWMARGHDSPGKVFLGLVMVLLSVGFLILTRSKTSIGLTALALILLAGFAIIAKGGPRVALAATFIGLCASAAFLLALALHEFDLAAMILPFVGDPSFTGRDELWAFAYRVAMERPLLGHGYGAFWDVGVANDPVMRLEPGTWLGDVEPGGINHAHNGYLELWLQLGLPTMLLATLVVVVMGLKGALYCVFAGGARGTRAAFAFLAIMPLIFLLHNLTEASLFMRGIFLHNVMLPILFLLARAHEFNGRRHGLAHAPLFENKRP